MDLFSIFYPKNELLMITGTNGKSTTCKMLEHILKYSKRKTHLGGNIGKPILNINPNKNSEIIVEASSFQLAYSKIIKPKYATILIFLMIMKIGIKITQITNTQNLKFFKSR